MLAECVLNISEGRRIAVIDEAVAGGGETVLDVHSDTAHNRSVLTLGGPLEVVEEAARRVVTVAVERIDLRAHAGAHPRFGAADVVPFVAPGAGWDDPPRAVLDARDRLAAWAAGALGLPCFLYGPERTLPEVRRTAFGSLRPDTGPDAPHPTAGACAVGARPVLVAYNLWLADHRSAGDESDEGGSRGADGGAGGEPDETRVLAAARALAAGLRGPDLRTLGLPVPGGAQVSCNVIGRGAMPLAELYDTVAAGAEELGCSMWRAELVGLLPTEVLVRAPRRRWSELDLGEDRTIEAQLAAKGYPTATGRS